MMLYYRDGLNPVPSPPRMHLILKIKEPTFSIMGAKITFEDVIKNRDFQRIGFQKKTAQQNGPIISII
ncbi:MAG: hypothetical protein U0586_14815 [Candidatus Brocadiaceae bacterium]